MKVERDLIIDLAQFVIWVSVSITIWSLGFMVFDATLQLKGGWLMLAGAVVYAAHINVMDLFDIRTKK